FWRSHFRVTEPARERPAPAVPVRDQAPEAAPPEPARTGYDAGMLAAFARAAERGDGADSVGALLRQTSAEVEAFEDRAAEAGRASGPTACGARSRSRRGPAR